MAKNFHAQYTYQKKDQIKLAEVDSNVEVDTRVETEAI